MVPVIVPWLDWANKPEAARSKTDSVDLDRITNLLASTESVDLSTLKASVIISALGQGVDISIVIVEISQVDRWEEE